MIIYHSRMSTSGCITITKSYVFFYIYINHLNDLLDWGKMCVTFLKYFKLKRLIEDFQKFLHGSLRIGPEPPLKNKCSSQMKPGCREIYSKGEIDSLKKKTILGT